jgi:hypothetical protein
LTSPAEYVLVAFMSGPPTASDLTHAPGAHTCQDTRPAGDPPSSTRFLRRLLRKLVHHARQLVATLKQDPPPDQLDAITRGFGTRDVNLIVARIVRGVRLAFALDERLARNAVRLDNPSPPRLAAASPPDLAAAPPPRPRAVPPAGQAAGQSAANRAARRAADDAALLAHLPTPEEIAAQIRRRPIGAIIIDICNDLGIAADHPLWADLTLVVAYHRGSCLRMMNDMLQRCASEHGTCDVPLIWPFREPRASAASRRDMAAATGPP